MLPCVELIQKSLAMALPVFPPQRLRSVWTAAAALERDAEQRHVSLTWAVAVAVNAVSRHSYQGLFTLLGNK